MHSHSGVPGEATGSFDRCAQNPPLPSPPSPPAWGPRGPPRTSPPGACGWGCASVHYSCGRGLQAARLIRCSAPALCLTLLSGSRALSRSPAEATGRDRGARSRQSPGALGPRAPWSPAAGSNMDSSAVPTNASNCTDPFAHSSSCSAPPSPGSWVNLSHLDGNLSDPCGPNRTERGGSDSLCPSTGSPSMVTAITIMALYSVVCVVGLFGNFLVMYVIVRMQYYWKGDPEHPPVAGYMFNSNVRQSFGGVTMKQINRFFCDRRRDGEAEG
ncbi:Mu-type opioid receptor [Tupaia chinensis]|uniref:Mu-type opioid receptor n=1 Tax=Tupaia chinensis TaxID=246437 RepID=L9LCG7_TUPCH|nr:Mu-type opioid receptor [Tupaia chinensis]